MTTEQLNIILKHLYDKKDATIILSNGDHIYTNATIILSNGDHIYTNPQVSCPYIEDNILHLEGDYFAWIEVKDIIAILNIRYYKEVN